MTNLKATQWLSEKVMGWSSEKAELWSPPTNIADAMMCLEKWESATHYSVIRWSPHTKRYLCDLYEVNPESKEGLFEGDCTCHNIQECEHPCLGSAQDERRSKAICLALVQATGGEV